MSLLGSSSVASGLLIWLALAGTACSPKNEPAEPVATPVVEEEPAVEERAPGPSDRDARELAELRAEIHELADRATKAELLLLEREARIAELEQRLESQQRMIDETISEVVRAKAKLRSVESKAEAASQIAEAEIALKTLLDLAGGEETQEYLQAAQLLEKGAQEFEQQNFGGAIYLTSQAKSIVSLGQLRLRNRDRIEASAGEVLFGVPVSLKVVRTSNVRKGPGLDFRVLATLDGGTPVTGYSYKGKWVHVKLEDGTDGWIYQALVGRR